MTAGAAAATLRRAALAALVALLVVLPASGARAQARPSAPPEPVRTEEAVLDPRQPPLAFRTAAGANTPLPVWSAATAFGTARFVSANDLAYVLRGTLQLRGDRAHFVAPGLTLDVVDGVAFARVDAREMPLAVAPRVTATHALLPLQLVLDVLPSRSTVVRFDPATGLYAVPRAAAPRAADVAVATDDGPAARSVTLPSIIGRAPSARPQQGPSAFPAPAAAPAGRRHTVVVDAGHGGPDAGMRGAPAGGPALLEKDVTLGIARELADALAARGVDVVLTRTRDTLIALADRGRIANARRGDLFVSVHVNAANPGWRDPALARGFETYFLSDARTEDARQVAARENESVRFEAAAVADAADPLRFVISDLAQNEHLRASSRLASAVQRQLGRVHPSPNRGVHQAGFKVLVTASMPAVLIETGFGTNAEDAAYLTSADGQRAIAASIADAVVEYLARYGGARGGAAAPERGP